MPRDRKAEKAEEKKREELERKREQERDRQKEEERRQKALEEEREFEQQEERRRQQAEAARLRAVERRRQEQRAQERTQQLRRQHEAERSQARQQELRRTSLEQGRAQERQDQARQDQSQERATARRRAEALQANQQERTGGRHAEQQAARQAEARAAQRSEDRAAQRSEERAAERSDERRADARAAQQSEARAAEQSEARAAQEAQERADSRRSAAVEEQRREQLTEDRRQAQREEDRTTSKQEQAQVAQAQARAEERHDAQRAEEQARSRAADRRSKQQAAKRQQQAQAAQAQARTEREAPTERQLRARLPTGHLSNGLPWLATTGNRIISAEDATRPARAVILRGVNRSGFHYAEPTIDFLEPAGITQADVAEMVSWGANVIRVPFNQDWALHGRHGHPPTEYLDNLDQLIFWTSSLGAYALLDLQYIDADTVYGKDSDGKDNHVPPLPNLESITVWTVLANRYREEPAVLYDIFNEPHKPLGHDDNPLETIGEDGITVPASTVTMRQWQPWARQLVAAIRKANLNSLIFVSGVDWGYDLRCMPLTIVEGGREVFANLVYSTHVYPWKGPKVAAGTLPADIPALTDSSGALNWTDAFGRLAATVPVFAGEWGGNDADASPWGEALAIYMSALGMGWTAWSWVDWPYLRQASLPSGLSMPTRFGNLVRHWLAMP